ncbi:hypothetical protein PGTUg99_034728 [Puccinia graminis f. sp. tritici]|uniref:Uncharacterized protein n=1 Tax=Puccinia graminis f. sp. tritici TaxID=56615 RepID=A0A5B0LY71_PUCGR|nr:hypothetical protein PGTUg99_034728 [Puccinia graminis f. sp. tritici]
MGKFEDQIALGRNLQTALDPTETSQLDARIVGNQITRRRSSDAGGCSTIDR